MSGVSAKRGAGAADPNVRHAPSERLKHGVTSSCSVKASIKPFAPQVYPAAMGHGMPNDHQAKTLAERAYMFTQLLRLNSRMKWKTGAHANYPECWNHGIW
jgi:hypothetical protein